jgi:hypothetical protein
MPRCALASLALAALCCAGSRLVHAQLSTEPAQGAIPTQFMELADALQAFMFQRLNSPEGGLHRVRRHAASLARSSCDEPCVRARAARRRRWCRPPWSARRRSWAWLRWHRR